MASTVRLEIRVSCFLFLDTSFLYVFNGNPWSLSLAGYPTKTFRYDKNCTSKLLTGYHWIVQVSNLPLHCREYLAITIKYSKNPCYTAIWLAPQRKAHTSCQGQFHSLILPPRFVKIRAIKSRCFFCLSERVPPSVHFLPTIPHSLKYADIMLPLPCLLLTSRQNFYRSSWVKIKNKKASPPTSCWTTSAARLSLLYTSVYL